jgi:ribosome maturation factor RimP
MKLLKKQIFDIAEEIIEKNDYLFIDLTLSGGNKNLILEIFIDSKSGVDAKNCADISKKIGDEIDKKNLIESKYRLTVSSPGIDRSLKYIDQYFKHIKRKFALKYISNGEQLLYEGKLTGINGDTLSFEKEKSLTLIKFKDIKSAKVLISF